MAEGIADNLPVHGQGGGFIDSALRRTRLPAFGDRGSYRSLLRLKDAAFPMYVTMKGALTRVVERSIRRLVTDGNVLTFNTA